MNRSFRSFVGPAALALALGCGGDAETAEAPSIAPTTEVAPTVEPAPAAPVPVAPPPTAPAAPVSLLSRARSRVSLGTVENVDMGTTLGMGPCLTPTAAVPPTVRVELAPGTRVTEVYLSQGGRRRNATSMEVVADGAVVGTANAGTTFPIDREVRELVLHPVGRDSVVCLPPLEIRGIPGPGALLGEDREPPTSTLPLLTPDETRLTLSAEAPAPSAATDDRAPFAAIAFAHGAETVTYELVVVRGRGDDSGAPLIPPPSTDPAALPGLLPWGAELPADAAYRSVCADHARRLVLSRTVSGPGLSPAARRPQDRTLGHVCGMISAELSARDVDHDGRLELVVRTDRGMSNGTHGRDERWIDAESFWTELETNLFRGRTLTEGADGSTVSIVTHTEGAPDDHLELVYESLTDSYVVVDHHRDPYAWEIRDATEHPLIHEIRLRLASRSGEGARAIGEERVPGTASVAVAPIALELLDRATETAIAAYACSDYDRRADDDLRAIGPIRSADDAAAVDEILDRVGESAEENCRCCGDCGDPGPSDISCVARLAIAPRDDQVWAAELAQCLARVEEYEGACTPRGYGEPWLWSMTTEAFRDAIAPAD